MTRRALPAILIAILVAFSTAAPASAQDAAALGGRWTLDPSQSQAPREFGFNADWMKSAASGDDSTTGGGRGRRGSSSGAFSTRPESAEDAARLRELTAEVRNPPTHLTIGATPTAVTITDERGRGRTFYPNGTPEELRLGDVPLTATAKWENGSLVVVYAVEQGRQLRCAYTTTANPTRLIVDVTFVERGGGDQVKRVYVPADSNEAAALLSKTSTANDRAPATARADPPNAAAASNRATFNQQPGAELKGLASLGVLVEKLSAQATACGLTQDAVESAVWKPLTDANLKVLKNSDEDTYVYVDIVTTSLPSGLCVSRYDATLYTHTTAKLSYQDMPVLVQVSLLHKGGLAGGSPAAHAASVLQGLTKDVESFAGQIRRANK